jgi:hypothetical protein
MKMVTVKKILSRFSKDKKSVKLLVEADTIRYASNINIYDYEITSRIKDRLIDIITNDYVRNNESLIKSMTDMIVKEFDLEAVVREGIKKRAEDLVRGTANGKDEYRSYITQLGGPIGYIK